MSQARNARVFLWQVAFILLLLLPVMLGTWYVWSKHQWAAQRLAELEPRHARLQGLLAKEAEFVQAAEQASALLRKHAYAVSVDVNNAGNDAQQRTREAFAGAGLTVASTQVLPSREEGAFDRIPVVVAVEGDMAQLQNALLAIRELLPTVWVDSITLRPAGVAPPSSNPRLSGQFRFSVLRERG